MHARGSTCDQLPPIGIHYVNITSSMAYPVIKRLAPALGLLAVATPWSEELESSRPRCVIRRASGRRPAKADRVIRVVRLIEIYGGPSSNRTCSLSPALLNVHASSLHLPLRLAGCLVACPSRCYYIVFLLDHSDSESRFSY